MDITEKAYRRSTVLKVTGRIDSETSPELEKAIAKLNKKGQYSIVMDLSGVDFVSSAGLRVLVTARKKSRRYNRGDVRLSGLSPRLKDAFDLVGFDLLFQIFDKLEDAVGSF
jgi:anti-sigma B factor antagonist